MNSQLNVALIHKLRGSLQCLAFFDILSMGNVIKRTLESIWNKIKKNHLLKLFNVIKTDCAVSLNK